MSQGYYNAAGDQATVDDGMGHTLVGEKNMWEWSRKGTSRAKVVTKDAARGELEFGTRYVYRPSRPEKTETFTGRGFFWAEAEVILTAMEAVDAPGLVTIVDTAGRSWQGLPADLSYEPIEGTKRWNLTLTLTNPERLGAEDDDAYTDGIVTYWPKDKDGLGYYLVPE